VGLVVAFLAAGALLAWPLRHGGAFLDDFLFLALGRHEDDLLALVTRDAVGGYFFRPLPLAGWWASVRLLGTGAPAQLCVSVALHVLNGGILYAFLRRLRAGPGPAALASLVFVCHPTAFAATAWLSDRFDLFSTGFGLGALVATESFLVAPRPRTLVAAAAALLASLLSKEIGYVFAAAGALMAAWVVRDRHAASPRDRLAILGTIAATSGLALGARAIAVRDVAKPLFAAHGWLATALEGTARWVEPLPRFLVVTHGGRLAIVAWCLLLLLLLVGALRGRRAPGREGLRMAGVGIAIMAVAAVAQSPVLGSMVFRPFGDAPFAFESLAASRLYYVPLAGFAMVVAGLAQHAAAGARSRRGDLAFALACVAAVAGLLATSRAIGREWAAYTQARVAPVLEAAVAALAPRTAVQPGCKVYLLSMPEEPGLALVIDVAVKQALPRGHPLMGCFIEGERAPWYNLVRSRGLPPAAERPLVPLVFEGRPFPPLRVGNLTYYYLRLPDASRATGDPNATFLAYRDGAFADVTADVRAGRRTVRFADELGR